MNNMEWYFDNETEDDVVVPKDYEQTESWSEWGMTSFPKKNFNFNSNVNMTHEELAFNGGKNFYTSINTSDSNNETSKSNNSSMSQELYNNGTSLLWNDQADFQQFTQEEARINHMDDIFFSSLLKEDQTDDNTITGNVFEGEMVNSHNVGSHVQNDDNSMEESVLKDLERVTALFTDKTRICFRDAFYRLAESSKQSVNSYEDGEPNSFLRDGVREDLELKTNVIDRAVANMMFHKFEFEDNHQTD